MTKEKLSKVLPITKELVRESHKYVVGVAIIKFGRNYLFKVKANNDYYAVLAAMRKFTASQALNYSDKLDWIEDSWEVEEKWLIKNCNTYTSLLNYFSGFGCLVSTPLIIKI